MPIKKYLFFNLFCIIICCFSSCKQNKTVDGTLVKPVDENGSSLSVEADRRAELFVYETDCNYLGHIDDKNYIVHLSSSDKKEMSGVFYLIDDKNLTLKPYPFQLNAKINRYILTVDNKKIAFVMKYNANENEMNAALSIINGSQNKKAKKKTQEESNSVMTVEFTKCIPDKTCPVSNRYKKPIYKVSIDSNVVYGKAKGAWASLHVDSTAKLAKELLPYLFKTTTKKMLNLTLDVYNPVGDTLKQRPAVVLFHGGAFFFGDKGDSEMRAWCSHLASLGYVVFSVNYRMGFELSKASIQKCGFKAIQDGHAAMRFIAHNAEKYRIDPDRIYAGGSSAGSITAMNIVYMNDANSPKVTRSKHFAQVQGHLDDSGNNYTDKFQIKGFINMWGALYEISDLKKYPVPMVSFHGTADKIVPFGKGYPFTQLNGKNENVNLSGMYFDEMYGSKAIHDVLKTCDVHHKFYPLQGEGHAPYRKKEDGSFNEIYYFIKDKMSEFLYEDLVYDIKITKSEDAFDCYCLSNCNAKEVHWDIEGGIILKSTDQYAQVRFFSNKKAHVLHVSGLLKNGADFHTKLAVKQLPQKISD